MRLKPRRVTCSRQGWTSGKVTPEYPTSAEVGYSGVTFPLVQPCLEHVTRLGFKRIVVFPYFLFSGILIDRIYGFTDEVAAAHPDIEFIKALINSISGWAAATSSVKP